METLKHTIKNKPPTYNKNIIKRTHSTILTKLLSCCLQTNSPVEETNEGATASTHAAELPADQADMAEADLQQPPLKKTALEDLLERIFTERVGAAQINRMCGIEAEIVRYRSEMSISLTSCPLKWWKENSKMYPLLSPLAKACLTTPVTSVPSERVLSTTGDVVTSQRSQLRDKIFFFVI